MGKEERSTYTIKMDANLGEVKIADEVVAIIAGLAAMEVEGVASMAGNATRELISKIQTMRKEADFEVTDKIQVSYEGTEKAESLFAKYAGEIGEEVLATAVEKKTPVGYTKEWNINGEKVNLGVEK